MRHDPDLDQALGELEECKDLLRKVCEYLDSPIMPRIYEGEGWRVLEKLGASDWWEANKDVV